MNSKNIIAYLALLTAPACTKESSGRRNAAQLQPEPPDLAQLRERGNEFYQSGEYRQAVQIYESGYEAAKSRGQLRPAVRFLNNLGSARYQLFQYREAVKAYLEARGFAAQEGDREMLGVLCFNLSSLYLDMGEIDAAAQSAQQGLHALGGITTDFRPKLLMQSGQIKIRQKNTRGGLLELREAVVTAARSADVSTEAQAWSELGAALLEDRNPRAAEAPLLEAYRLRKLNHDDHIYYSYERLGQLRMVEGDAGAASALFSRAIDSARRISPAAVWNGYYQRGKARVAQGFQEEAFADYGVALNWLRRWRAEVLPADAFRVSSEVALHDVFAAYIDLGRKLYREKGDRQIAEQAFAVTEESRTASLRTLLAQSENFTRMLPAEYWEALSRLHNAEAALVANDRADTAEVKSLRLKLAELETRAGLELAPDLSDAAWSAGEVLNRIRETLSPDAAYLGFTASEPESWLWVVTREGFELQRLPAQSQIAEMAGQFTRSVAGGSPEAVSSGRELYTALFGHAGQSLMRKRVWIMALDGPLYELPFAALVTANGATPHYLAEEHVVEITPGVWSLLRGAASRVSGPFVALGDPIYNRADPRVERLTTPAALKSEVSANATELSRLAGSDREIDQCARLWRSHGSEVVLLEGAAASKKNVIAVFERRPSVLHMAAHIIFPNQEPGSGLIALTLQPHGGVEFLSASEVAAMRVDLGLVVLNGCSSAQGTILPGAGLMGMTRAWLAAGARAVIATRWPTPDDNTEMFSFFYDELDSLRRVNDPHLYARALARAQVRQLRTAGPHAGPAWWGAYFCAARD